MAITRAQRLRQLIEDRDPLVLPYGACALHAKMAERIGYKAIALSGGWATAYLLGRPDAGLISPSDLVMLARYMVQATSIPVISDADQGFGSAVNTHHLVRSFINAGVSGIHIEDQPFPKQAGVGLKRELVSTEEMVGKLRAARDAKMELDPDFVIIARTEALTPGAGNLQETIRRIKAYREKGGADVTYVEAPSSIEEIRQIRDAVDGPVFCATYNINPHPSVEELRDLGQCIIQMSGMICEPASMAAWNSLEDFHHRGMTAWNEYLDHKVENPVSNMCFDLVGFPEVMEMGRKYSSP